MELREEVKLAVDDLVKLDRAYHAIIQENASCKSTIHNNFIEMLKLVEMLDDIINESNKKTPESLTHNSVFAYLASKFEILRSRLGRSNARYN